MTLSLQGRAVIVTGGFGVLGSALTRLLLERGAQVAALDLNEVPASLVATADFLPLGKVNLTETTSAEQAMTRVVDTFGHIDAVVNVAGGFAWETFESGSLDTWDRLYQMNVRTAIVSTKAALPHILSAGNGRVVNVSALAANKAGPGVSAYAASKAGVARFTESLAEELKQRDVTVNAVMPSIIDTPTNRADMPDQDFTAWVTPEALSVVIAFLLSAEGQVITGACLPVSGRV
ncbi:NAD(P)-dependent dehydrogenase, short-chain alcohol dehydrogenase family [Halopseudomonas litoralis]|uniref:NAD(P)-dependent dehydrogenase, short-chain alcohol dehydrogenase family n=1 Tax=Halopseudomonas litoralis TaxID=797277 RepID=A0A1H1W1J3_9GAMM|nr:SDR family NAD(P)-dependent oxidoreductase [Halopseudomonas litoralis]SDS90386.1 NAD(P)-dependent dehydrogenase, short-chain alcohol dehydrogenase family [Halopseudomonas litoralis]